LTLLRLLAKHQGTQPLEAEAGLLQSEQQPKIPSQHLGQHLPILCSQGITMEALNQRLAVFAVQVDLFRSLHDGLYPLVNHIGNSFGFKKELWCSG
jgi:hypothetical protein